MDPVCTSIDDACPLQPKGSCAPCDTDPGYSPLGATLHLKGRRFLISSHLASGGTADTFCATSSSGEKVVVKMLHANGAADAVIEERFLREAELICRLSHPCLVKGFAHGRWHGRPYMVEEAVPGSTLATILSAAKSKDASPIHAAPLSVRDALLIAEDICSVLVYLYFDGRVIAHRDIKPANIMVEPNGRAKLIDLGIAKTPMHVLRDVDTGFLGSLAYVSPEQIDDAASVDIRTDIYSLGAVLFEMLAGVKAFPGSLNHDIIGSHLVCDPPALPRNGPLGEDIVLFKACSDLLGKALATDRLKRFQTPSEFLCAISEVELTERASAATSGRTNQDAVPSTGGDRDQLPQQKPPDREAERTLRFPRFRPSEAFIVAMTLCTVVSLATPAIAGR